MVSRTGFGRGCQCAKGTQDTESSISNDTLRPNGTLITSANKETKGKNFIQFSEVPTHVILRITFLRLLHSHVMLMNELANYMWVCFQNHFPKQAWLIQTSKSLT